MCGIAGVLRFNHQPVETFEIKNLTDAIAHRGPDGEGCWLHKKAHLGFGHRRLSILDLSDHAAQPMHYADGRLTLVFNGEIFNFAELREELKQKGYSFYSDSDTEVLLAAYHAWGKDCLNRFNGFWAFALWDEQTQELWLARDRFGIKPLYFLSQPGHQFVFASETNQFKHVRDFVREPDATLASYVMQDPWGIEGLGKTIFKQIEQVRPGHELVINSKGEINIKQWWSTAAQLVDVPENYDQQVEQFKALFEDAIKLRLRSDVSIGSALSGGLDSSAVYCSIHHFVSGHKDIYRLPGDWQRAFTAEFPGTEQDERVFAEQVLQHTGGKGQFFDMNAGMNDLPGQIIKSISDYDTIYSTPLLIMDGVYRTMKSSGITVSLDGHGVDEMLYGYSFNVYQALEFARASGNEAYAANLEDIYMSMLPADQVAEKNKPLKKVPPSFFQHQMQRVQRRIKRYQRTKNWFDVAHTANLSLPSVTIPEQFKGSEAMLYHTFHHTALPTILRNFDRGAMRNSIEILMPFLDYRLVSFIFSLPMQSKIGGGFTKRIMRDAMKDILPESIRTRKLKTGFNAPLQSWFQNQLKTLILDEVSSAGFVNSNYWNGSVIRDFVLLKYKQEKWSDAECQRLWPVLSAHLLFKQENN